MSRLIDVDVMLARLEEWNTSDSTDKALYNFTLHRILEQPTIEPDRKKGKWIYNPDWESDGECGYECDQCGMGSDVDYNYCMRCGADMRG